MILVLLSIYFSSSSIFCAYLKSSFISCVGTDRLFRVFNPSKSKVSVSISAKLTIHTHYNNPIDKIMSKIVKKLNFYYYI